MDSSCRRDFWHIPSLIFLLGMVTVFFVLSFGGCADGFVDRLTASTAAPCAVSRVRYPTTSEEFRRVYGGRAFYADGNHLGYDNDLPEGTAIHAIACGTVRIYRPADGYGTLAVVIEHWLPRAVTVRNGLGEQVAVTSFLSIYGHLRPTSLRSGGTPTGIRVGDTVGPDDVIGYVQNRAVNGDGDEHLHLGIRLQSSAEAMRTDVNWFRGYDAMPSQRRWYADPVMFLAALTSPSPTARWHPAGTVLAGQSRSDEWFRVGADDTLHPLTPVKARDDGLPDAMIVSDEELHCYAIGTNYVPELTRTGLIRFDGAPAVYEEGDAGRDYRAFISYEAFRSWGWQDSDIIVHPASERPAFFATYRNAGMRRMREGTLVKGRGSSEVAVVSGNARLPIADWATFAAMGYRTDQVVEIDPETLDDVAYPRGSVITMDLATLCHRPRLCMDGSCDAGTSGGGTGGELDAGAAEADVGSPTPMASDTGTSPPSGRTLRVALDASLSSACPDGWEILIWDNLGQLISSTPGAPLSVAVPSAWRGFVMMSARCGSAYRDWSPANRSARDAGIASIRLDDADLLDGTRVCADPWGAGVKVAIPLEPSSSGSCPR